MKNSEFAAKMQLRTKQYALRVIGLIEAIPKTTVGRVIGHQLIRAATSIGANYRAACRARSTAEFSAKLGIVIEEADECIYWIELLIEGKLLRSDLLQPLLQETTEILATMVAARKTAQQHHS
ncbi:four helix bundle protein [Candidatus Uhrbacteria bacterium]|nr:four helix bundle protein [Candidatus Uhrbacteria bacterium]